jgi:hypothetical protein
MYELHVVTVEVGRVGENGIVTNKGGKDREPVLLGVNGKEGAFVHPPVGETVEKRGNKGTRAGPPSTEEQKGTTEVPAKKVGLDDSLREIREKVIGPNEADEIVFDLVLHGIIEGDEVAGSDKAFEIAAVAFVKSAPL